LRDYGVEGQLGLERTPEEYVAKMVEVFREVRRVLRGDGTLWLNLGDSYATGGGAVGRCPGGGEQGKRFLRMGHVNTQPNRMPIPGLKPKDLIGIPWMVAFALRSDGWYLRQDIIWAKPNPMPESVRDRCTKSHEYVFLLSKNQRYFCDMEVISDIAVSVDRQQPNSAQKTVSPNKTPWLDNRYAPGATGYGVGKNGTRNKRSVWTVATEPDTAAHFATFPTKLIEPMILCSTKENGIILDPFIGSGTTALVAIKHRRRCVGIELNPKYIDEILRPNLDTVMGGFGIPP
jgi:DNA modification methylase